MRIPSDYPRDPLLALVYAIFCDASQGCYVGATTRTIYSRSANHRAVLRGNRHQTPLLQADWNQYGEEAFRVEILERVSDWELLAERERQWIETLRDQGRRIYNVRLDVPYTLDYIKPELRARYAARKKEQP